MSAKYFEYYTIILRGAVFSWTHCSYLSKMLSCTKVNFDWSCFNIDVLQLACNITQCVVKNVTFVALELMVNVIQHFRVIGKTVAKMGK